jgi:hypothetical protein
VQPAVNEVHLTIAEQVMERGVRPRYVYFLVAECSDDDCSFDALLKIGTTCNLEARRQSLYKSSGPAWLSNGCDAATFFGFVNVVMGDQELEGHFHRAFADFRAGNEREWFWYTNQVRDALDFFLDDWCVCEMCQLTDFLHTLPWEFRQPFFEQDAFRKVRQ